MTTTAKHTTTNPALRIAGRLLHALAPKAHGTLPIAEIAGIRVGIRASRKGIVWSLVVESA